MTTITNKQFASLTPNDRSEITKFQRYLKMKMSKKGRMNLSTQKNWKNYQGI